MRSVKKLDASILPASRYPSSPYFVEGEDSRDFVDGVTIIFDYSNKGGGAFIADDEWWCDRL
ncbi:MAG: hypothetical protein ACOC2Z_17010 [Coleofasciculus sp.]